MTDEKTFEQIWEDDRLDRAKDAVFLRTFLANRVEERKRAGQPASYVLNIDANWGDGKSFFLERFGDMLRSEGFLVAHVNAWQDDHAEDPLLSVMDAIDTAVAPLVKSEKKARDRWNQVKRAGGSIAVAAVKGAVVQVAKKAIGSGIDEIAEIWVDGDRKAIEKSTDGITKTLGEVIEARGQTLLASFREGKRTISSFRKGVNEFLAIATAKGQQLPLYVLVDELDRCRPPFAIAMLERMKHLFDIDQVVFVVATDTSQLSYSISAVYGAGFDGRGYLSRFFNRSYHFEKASLGQIITDLLNDDPIDTRKISLPHDVSLESLLTGGFEYFALPVRDAKQVYDILRTVVTAWSFKSKIELVALFPVVVAHQLKEEYPVGSGIEDKFAKLVRKFGGGKARWFTKSWGASQSSPEGETVHGDVLAIALMNTAARSSLPAILERHVSSNPSQRWVDNRLMEEFALVYGNSHHPARPPYSMILQYPEIVRSAGRLSSSKAIDN